MHDFIKVSIVKINHSVWMDVPYILKHLLVWFFFLVINVLVKTQCPALFLMHIDMDLMAQGEGKHEFSAKHLFSYWRIKVGARKHWNIPYIPRGPLQRLYKRNNRKYLPKHLKPLYLGLLAVFWAEVVALAEGSWLHLKLLHCFSSFCIFMEILSLLSITTKEELGNWRHSWHPSI